MEFLINVVLTIKKNTITKKDCLSEVKSPSNIDPKLEKCIKTLNKIDIDKSNDIIAVWHDESQLNRYMISNVKLFKFMIPDYCYPENYHENL